MKDEVKKFLPPALADRVSRSKPDPTTIPVEQLRATTAGAPQPTLGNLPEAAQTAPVEVPRVTVPAAPQTYTLTAEQIQAMVQQALQQAAVQHDGQPPEAVQLQQEVEQLPEAPAEAVAEVELAAEPVVEPVVTSVEQEPQQEQPSEQELQMMLGVRDWFQRQSDPVHCCVELWQKNNMPTPRKWPSVDLDNIRMGMQKLINDDAALLQLVRWAQQLEHRNWGKSSMARFLCCIIVNYMATTQALNSLR